MMSEAQQDVWFIAENEAGWSEAMSEAVSTGVLMVPAQAVSDADAGEGIRERMTETSPLDSFAIGELRQGRGAGLWLTAIGYLLPNLTMVGDDQELDFLIGVVTQQFEPLHIDAFQLANDGQNLAAPLFSFSLSQIEAIGRTFSENKLPPLPLPRSAIDIASGTEQAQQPISRRFGSETYDDWRSDSGVDGPPETDGDSPSTPDGRTADEPCVWVCQYKPGDRVEDWARKVEAGKEIPWKTGRESLPPAARSGDPVIYWRGVRNEDDRGGLVGTGVLVDPSLTPDDRGVNRFRTRVTEFFDDKPIPRKTFLDHVGLSKSWPGPGAFIRVKAEKVAAINELLEENGRASVPPKPSGSRILELISDTPASEHDYLNRSALAFMVAAHLSRVWFTANSDDGGGSLTKRWLNRLKFWRWFSRSSRPSSKLEDAVFGRPGFVMHVDAPWGGGKSTFANYLARILNRRKFDDVEPRWLKKLPMDDPQSWPIEYRRPWHIVFYNAWQHQHLDPPWWSFYQAMRRQCFGDLLWGRVASARSVPIPLNWIASVVLFLVVRAPYWVFLWAAELRWRVFNPKVVILLSTFAVSLSVAGFLVFAEPESAADQQSASAETSPDNEQVQRADGGNDTADSPPDGSLEQRIKEVLTSLSASFGAGGWLESVPTAILLALSGGTGIWSVFSVFTESLLPGTTPAAKNYSLGSGDPLERFRRHFHFMMKRLRRPILVVVDDIDRCRPDVVVELIRGMQTILRSPRVIFLVLGDLDWISKAFETQHDMMKDIAVGAEHTFGGRFVEKAFQMSMVLPSIEEETQKEFVGRILGTSAPPVAEVEGSLIGSIKETLIVVNPGEREKLFQGDQRRIQTEISESGLDEESQGRVIAAVNLRFALRNAGDRRSSEITRHRLAGIARVLPPNPRQIKRIINGITLYQEVGRIQSDIQPETDAWRKLALWIVLMTEWPTTWNRLSNYPGLIDIARSGTYDAIEPHLFPHDREIARRLAMEIRQDQAVWKVLTFSGGDRDDWPATNIESGDIVKMRAFVPPSGAVDTTEPAEAV